LASALFVANLDHGSPDGMVWYGMMEVPVRCWLLSRYGLSQCSPSYCLQPDLQ